MSLPKSMIPSLSEGPPAPNGLRRRSSHLWAFAIGAGLLATHLVVTGRHGWFLRQDFQFLGARHAYLDRGDVGGFLFIPHDHRWSTIPILIQALVVRISSLNSYLLPMAVLVAGDLALVVLLRLVLRRIGLQPWLASGPALLFLAFGRGSDGLAFGFTIDLVLGSALLLGLFILADHVGPPDRRDWWGAGLAVTGVMISVLGLVGVIVIGGWTVARGRRKAAAVIVAPALIVYLIWFWTYGGRRIDTSASQSIQGVAVVHPRPGVLSFVTDGLWTSAGSFLPWHIASTLCAALVAVGIAWCVRVRRTYGGRALALASVSVLFYVISAGTTVTNGDPSSDRRRFAFVGALFLVPVIALTVQHAGSALAAFISDRFARVAICLLFAASLIGNFVILDASRREVQEEMATARSGLSALAGSPYFEVLDDGAVLDPELTADLTVGGLRRLVERGLVRPSTALSPGERLDIESRFFVSTQPAGMLDQPLSFESYLFGVLEATGDGCVTAHVDLTKAPYLYLRLQPTRTTVETVQIRYDTGRVQFSLSHAGVDSSVRELRSPTQEVSLRVLAGGLQIVLYLDDGSVVCGVRGLG